MIAKIEGEINIGITTLVGKINEIVEQMNVDITAKDKTIATLQADAVAKDEIIAKLSAELTATRADAGLAAKEPVVAIPIKEEPIEPVIEEPIGG